MLAVEQLQTPASLVNLHTYIMSGTHRRITPRRRQPYEPERLAYARLCRNPIETRQLEVNGIISVVATSTIRVRVQADAGRNEFVGVREGVLVVRVAAPALDGRANRAARRLLAKRLGVAPSKLTITRGQRSRDKIIQVEDVDQATLDSALQP